MCDVLLIDDDGELLHSLARALSCRIAPLNISGATSIENALELFNRYRPRVVVVDLCLDEKRGIESGFDLISRMRALDGSSRIIVLTGHGSLSHGVRALRLGAASFIEKPAEPEGLAAVIIDAAGHAQLRREFDKAPKPPSPSPLSQLVGRSDAMQSLRDRICFIATTQHPVLILGETGTGKGLCARVIHECSSRGSRRLVHVQPNYGGGDLAQNELFGHIRGAFTGAVDSRPGLAMQAHEGTLFFDELDEFSYEIQVRLLDLVQEQRIRPVGSDSFTIVNCRFIAAMNRPLDEALAAQKIRRDLYHRISHNVLHMPPLRERLEDIPELCESILDSLRSRERVEVFEVKSEVLECLGARSWPGNIRELQAVVENGAYHARYQGRSFISCEDISMSSVASRSEQVTSFHERTERFKRHLVEEALNLCEGSQVRAARMLGLDRGTLRRIVARS
jgi:DNA-binding NtrC family response regulator